MIILSDFVQGDPNAEKLYRKVGKWIKEHQPDACFAIGEQCNQYRRHFPKNTRFFPSTDAFLEVIDGFTWENATILVKGARAFSLERVVYRLGLQTHRTILDVNLSAMERNLRHFRSKLPDRVKMMGMVKAFSYGVGAVEIARFLEYQNVDYLAVAYIDEGLELRKTGITLPILVLNPDVSGFPLMHEYRLEPEIFSFSTLKAWKRITGQHGDQLSPIHLKIDTGMNRLGFSRNDLPELLPRLHNVPVASIMSHLVASDDSNKRMFTESQIVLFKQMTDEIEASLGYTTIKHILNSSGIANYAKAAFDMVRLGIGLYGGVDNENLSPALRWRAYISQIRTVEKGAFIGYGCSYQMPRNGKIAVITVGYGDGFRRMLSNGAGKVYINGKACPVVGKVCMDMTMVDVTDINCSEGDEVEIFGEHQSLFDIADAMDTIPYEVLTGISPRVQRVYYRE
jgi:Alr-MurF fusion protein